MRPGPFSADLQYLRVLGEGRPRQARPQLLQDEPDRLLIDLAGGDPCGMLTLGQAL
jgi:hypothetical protein